MILRTFYDKCIGAPQARRVTLAPLPGCQPSPPHDPQNLLQPQRGDLYQVTHPPNFQALKGRPIRMTLETFFEKFDQFAAPPSPNNAGSWPKWSN